jgi:hypothetical protein
MKTMAVASNIMYLQNCIAYWLASKQTYTQTNIKGKGGHASQGTHIRLSIALQQAQC